MTEETIIPYKQYIILPKKPKMSKGKLASQACHATFIALNKQKDKKLIEKWRKKGMSVIVLQCKDTQELVNTQKYLDEWKIVNGLCIDEGLTEVRPMTPTALATGVLEEKDFWIFETMRLFK